MINDTAIHFFRHPIIIASVAGFHVKDRNSHPLRQNTRQTTIGIAKN